MPTHAEKRIFKHDPRALYDLVADVARYPEFLPWCLAVRIRKRSGPVILADLVIGFKMLRERFTSEVTLNDSNPDALRIDVKYIQGPMRYLNNHWIFLPHEEGCLIDFYVDFEFHSKLLQKLMQPLFNEAVKRMVQAFEQRAEAILEKS
jgi:coenzyme Q-binding protein COQ10|tara:strand:+ start:245 stop:691 length:447 start_codon:yes stop_codon:yes gene_type:complete